MITIKKLMLLAMVAMLTMTGCSSAEPPMEDSQDSVAPPPLRYPEEADHGDFPKCEEVLSAVFEAERNYDFDLASSMYWGESLDVFTLTYADLYPSESFNDTNFELVEYEIESYERVENPAGLETRLYYTSKKLYWYGELKEGLYFDIMVFIPEEGWKKSARGYIGTRDLEFKESRVAFNKDSSDTVTKYIKFMPRKVIFTGSGTYVRLDIKSDFTDVRDLYYHISPWKSPLVDTEIVLGDGENSYSGILDNCEIKKPYAGDASISVPTMLVKLDDNIHVNTEIRDISIRGLVQKMSDTYRTTSVKIMENGEFLNKQYSEVMDFRNYNEEIKVPSFKGEWMALDTVITGEGNDYFWNTSGNRINGGNRVLKDGWNYFNYNKKFAREDMATGTIEAINDHNAVNLNRYGNYIFYMQYGTIYRYDMVEDTSQAVTEGFKVDSIQIIGDYLYYKGEGNIGRIFVNCNTYFEPLVSGNIGSWDVYGDSLYYVDMAEDYTVNDKIMRLDMNTLEKEMLLEDVYNQPPHIHELGRLLVDGDYIFFEDHDSFGTIFRMNHDGTGIIDLTESSEYIYTMDMDEDYIYFVEKYGYFYKMRKDGSEGRIELAHDEINRMSVLGEEIHYIDDDGKPWFIYK